MEAIIGIFGIIVGILVSEVIRWTNRIEILNNQIFQERLKDYINLFNLMQESYNQILQLFDSFEKISEEEREEIISKIIFPIVEFGDLNSFFISEELLVQCSTLFMGVEEISLKNIEEISKKYIADYKLTIEMIKNESGINILNKNYKNIFGYKHKSKMITHYMNLKKENFRKNESEHSSL